MKKHFAFWFLALFLVSASTAENVNRIGANGLIFITDFEKPRLKEGEMAVFPYSDEATILLEQAKKIKESRGRGFRLAIDCFCGDGKSSLPMASHGIAERVLGGDINPRAIQFAQENARLNHLDANCHFCIRDVVKDPLLHSDAPGDTLWFGNAPCAIKMKGARLEVMRDGGENGLALAKIFVAKALEASESGDVILGFGYSRIRNDGTIEMEEEFQKMLQPYGGRLEMVLLDCKLWRGFNGKKEQDNPMPITEETFAVKANPSNEGELFAYKNGARLHIQSGYNRLGCYCYIIHR